MATIKFRGGVWCTREINHGATAGLCPVGPMIAGLKIYAFKVALDLVPRVERGVNEFLDLCLSATQSMRTDGSSRRVERTGTLCV
jgi:hypothetical protein